MRFSNDEVRATIVAFIHATDQNELRYVVAFCLGFYGYLTHQIWREITKLMNNGTIKP